jgi:O-antigen chain-terminating methyltransferase
MAEITDSEIDVEQLMAEIRAAVAKREAEGQRSLIGASLELYNMLSAAGETPSQRAELSTLNFQPEEYALLPQLRLQPEFVPRKDDHYQASDLLQYHDHTFIWNAYRAILKREPDEEGLKQFLKKLRGGRFNKIDVLASLRYSQEGKSRNVTIDGLARPAMIRRFYRVPVLGYLLELAVGIARLPTILRSQREFEGHALAQQQLIAAHLNQVSHTSFQVTDSLSRELTEVSAQLSKGQKDLAESFARELSQVSIEQRKFAELQHQQIVGLFREQREIIERLKNVKDELEARLAQLDASLKNRSARPSTSVGQASSDESRGGLDELFASFPEQFRGKREEVREGLKFYLPFLKEAEITDDILDIGCGRGEWLELLREEGLKGRGVELNHVLTEQARNSGLEVIEENALSYLRGVPDQSLNAVTGFHFIEHLSFETLIELIDEIARTLRPSGLVIFETPNPKNLVVGACNFYSDPTHLKPLFPDTIEFIMSNRGFTQLRLEYLNPVGGSPFDDGSERSQALNSWLYGPRDFALIGRKA